MNYQHREETINTIISFHPGGASSCTEVSSKPWTLDRYKSNFANLLSECKGKKHVSHAEKKKDSITIVRDHSSDLLIETDYNLKTFIYK